MHQSLCNRGPEGNKFFNDTICMDLADRLPECLDSMQYSYQQQTLASKTDAMRKCVYMIDEFWESRFSDHDPYDYRTKVNTKAPSCYVLMQLYFSALSKDVASALIHLAMSWIPRYSRIQLVQQLANNVLYWYVC